MLSIAFCGRGDSLASAMEIAARMQGIRILAYILPRSQDFTSSCRRVSKDLHIPIYSHHSELLSSNQHFSLNISMYYDRLFDLPFLKRVPTVNLHNSLLPRHRGVRPLEYALAEGDRNLGVTLHFVDEGIDTGPIIYQKSFRRTEGQTMGEIREKMMILGKELIVKALAEFPDLPQKVQSTREGCYHSKEDAIRDGFFSQSS